MLQPVQKTSAQSYIDISKTIADHSDMSDLSFNEPFRNKEGEEAGPSQRVLVALTGETKPMFALYNVADLRSPDNHFK